MVDLFAALSVSAELARRHLVEPALEGLTRRPAVGEKAVHRNSCNLCEAICGVEVTVDAGRVVDIRGDQDDPLSVGHVCPKSVSLADILNDRDRLRRPVRRIGETWEEIGWDEAIDLVATKLAEIQRDHGLNAVGVYLGNPTVHSLGGMTHGTEIGSVLGTHNRFAASSVDQLPHHVVSSLLYGHQLLLPVPDLERTSFLLMFGANPRASNGSMMTAPGMGRRLREIQARGGRVVVVDPRRTETAEVADEHIFIRPGTDAAVLLSMLNVVLAERVSEPPSFVTGFDEVRAMVAEFTPDAASHLSGVPAETIRRLALEFADADGAACYGRVGVSTQRYGTLCHWAIQVLNIVTGNLGREGGTLFSDPAIDVTRIMGSGAFGRRRSRVRGLPSFAGDFPVATLTEEITTPGDGQIRAMVTVAGNPVLSTPAGAALDGAFAQLDFMVAVDLYINETTRHADVILPPTSALEREHYDIVFRHFGVRNTAKYTPAVLPKPDGARDDWEIFRDLGLAYLSRRAGSGLAGFRRRMSTRDLATRLRLRLSPRDIVDILLRTGEYKLTVREVLAHPSGLDLGPLRPGVERKLQTRNRKIALAPPEIVAGLDELRADLAEDPVDEGQLLLIGRRHVRSNNSWGHNYGRLVTGPSRHGLLMHPKDAARHHVSNGPALLTSRVGTIRVDIEQTEDIMEGTVSLPHGYGHTRSDARLTVANRVDGASINDITDPQLLDVVSGNAAFCGLPVTIAPIG